MQYFLIKDVEGAKDEERDYKGNEKMGQGYDPKNNYVEYFFKHIFGKQKREPDLTGLPSF